MLATRATAREATVDALRRLRSFAPSSCVTLSLMKMMEISLLTNMMIGSNNGRGQCVKDLQQGSMRWGAIKREGKATALDQVYICFRHISVELPAGIGWYQVNLSMTLKMRYAL